MLKDGAAMRAGLDLGDELVALDGKRLDAVHFDRGFESRRAGDVVDVLVARHGVMKTVRVELDGPTLEKVSLVPDEQATEEQRAARRVWLGG
jgi:predicted metalloprotease with PDZ domain